MTLAKPFSDHGNAMLIFIKSLQKEIFSTLCSFEKNITPIKDNWNRGHNKGGGISCVIEDGNIFEKAGVNISSITGEPKTTEELKLFETLIKKLNPSTPFDLTSSRYYATGISLVIHPFNPHIPTVHLNYRFFELQNHDSSLWWFGGGSDLTPYIYDPNCFKHFHATLKKVSPKNYPLFKRQCDNYFFLPHRNEHRGIGGIFFDHLHTEKAEYYLNLVQNYGNSFLNSYIPIVESNQNKKFSENEKNWQLYRRGRYVEFNLIHDKGTLFGLKTNGRIESILMSLPKHASWHYNESKLTRNNQKLLDIIKKTKNWA